jgi:hypothetical protein
VKLFPVLGSQEGGRRDMTRREPQRGWSCPASSSECWAHHVSGCKNSGSSYVLCVCVCVCLCYFNNKLTKLVTACNVAILHTIKYAVTEYLGPKNRELKACSINHQQAVEEGGI